MMQDRLKMIETMLETNPKDSFLHYAAALEHQKNGEITTAIKIIQKIIKNDPEYLASYYQLGKMLEENLVTSMIKSDGDPFVFFTRPIAMWLALGTLVVVLWPVMSWLLGRRKAVA